MADIDIFRVLADLAGIALLLAFLLSKQEA